MKRRYSLIFGSGVSFFTALSLVIANGYIPSYDKLCVSHSFIGSDVDGTYEYSYLSSNTNASVYYNMQSDRYIFLWITADIKQYLIGPDPTKFSAHSYCTISTASVNYLIHPTLCTNGWISYSLSRKEWRKDTNMRLTNCNDVCITGDNDIYTWSYYDLNTNTSIYNNSDNIYLSTSNNDWYLYNDSSQQRYNLSDITNIGYCASSCDNGIFTPYYGVMKPSKEKSILNGGRINEIISWAVYNDSSYDIYESIGYLQFKSDNISDIIGSGGGPNAPYFDLCEPFKLSQNDYINGYRVIYDEFVYGLIFYTFKHKVYSCNATDLDYNEYHDSGVIYDDDYYLSGFNIYVDWIIDAISFQFTSINNCTNAQTANPTMYPSIYPSIYPSTTHTTDAFTPYSTRYPSSNPTVYPSLKPTIYPSSNPIIAPTLYPSLDRTVTSTSTQLPTFNIEPTRRQPPTLTNREGEVYETTSYDTVIVTEYESVYVDRGIDTDTNTQIWLLMTGSVVMISMMIVFVICIGKCKNDQQEEEENDKERKVTKSGETPKGNDNNTVKGVDGLNEDKTRAIKHTKTASTLLNEIWNSYLSRQTRDGAMTTPK